MTTILTKISPQARAAIEASLRTLLKNHPLASFTIEAGEDDDGEEAIFVILNYKLSEHPFNADLAYAVRSDIRRKLIELGESRYAYIRHNLHNGQGIKS